MLIDANRPASRILAMLELLQDRPGLSGPDLATALGVTSRTIRRYVVTLQEMGIPVEPATGRHGGYWLRPGYRMPPLMFSADEAIGLAVALLTTRVSGTAELPVPVADALAKIERSLPTELAGRIITIREGFRMARNPWADSSAFPRPEILADVIQATLSHQRAWVRYGSSEGNQTSRDVDLWGVLYLDGRWYTHGWCHLRQSPRTFRVDRMRRIDLLPETAEPPPAGFDIEDAVMRSLALTRSGGEFELVVEGPIGDVRAYLAPPTAILEALGEQRTRAWGTTENPYWLAARLASMPFRMQVLRTDALKQAMRETAQRMLDAVD
jgi:predicted DNA-binding transcriptional regulator YafY